MVFWNKGYYVIYPVYNFSNKTLSHDSNYIMDVVTWPKLVTLAFVQEKLSWPQFYKDLTRKTAFFEERSWFKFNNLGLALGINLKFYTSLPKGLKLKVRKFWGLILFAPILNRVKYEDLTCLWLYRKFDSKIDNIR